MRPPRCAMAVLAGATLAVASGACDDPSATREPSPDDALMVLAVLDPDTADQFVMLLTAGATGRIEDPTVEVRHGGAVVASGGPVPEEVSWGETIPCTDAFGTMNRPGGAKRCLHVAVRPEHERTYELIIRATGRPTARGTTTVPGAFGILSVDALGDPPGTEGLRARWTRSGRADRYFVAIHAEEHPRCLGGSCEDLMGGGKNLGWYISVRDTFVDTRIDPALVEGGEGGWMLEVVALDAAAAAHLTTGTNTDLFPVPPVSNVEGGLGFVGSWVRRSQGLNPTAGENAVP